MGTHLFGSPCICTSYIKAWVVWLNVNTSVSIRLVTYLCESDFSTLVNIKTKPGNRLDCEAHLRVHYLLQSLEINIGLPIHECKLQVNCSV